MKGKVLLAVLLFASWNVNCSDRLKVDSIPWTDACYFWSMTGKRLPVFNKNLMGNQLSIGGIKYKDGLAGHTPFSVVYNLSGEALSFSALVGLDDEAHPRDSKTIKSSSVEVQILVDRKIVKRIIVFWGDKAIPVKIDLRGKKQIELRGTYRTGFVKQRINFVNAYFEVKDKDSFLKKAAEWQRKVKKQLFRKISYPSAPMWRKIKIRKVRYRTWDNAYELSNNFCSLIVVPEYGGRVLKFALRNKQNVLFQGENPSYDNLCKRGIAINGGGNFSRPQPRNYFNSLDPILAYGNYKITFPKEGEVEMTSGISWYMGLQYIYTVKLAPDTAKATIITRHRNINSFPVEAGVWSLTRIATAKASVLLMPKEMSHPCRKSKFEPQKLSNMLKQESKGNFNRINLNPSFVANKKCYLEIQNFPQVNTLKVLMKDGTFFVKNFYYNKSMEKYMGNFYPAHLYVCRKFIELESHGPLKSLSSGKAIAWTEEWMLQ